MARTNRAGGPVIVVTALTVLTCAAAAAMAASVVGTPGSDDLRGTTGADVIEARAGDDRVTALAGNDRVSGGPGHDVLDLGPGADHALRSGGRDVVFGGPGPDTARGSRYAELGDGDDRYSGGGWNEVCLEVHLGRGDDTTPVNWRGGRPGIRDCVIRGGPGNDRIHWGGTDAPRTDFSATLYGGPGADVIISGYNADTMIGGSGPDRLRSLEYIGPDRIFAGQGDDRIYVESDTRRPPFVHCGPGFDTVTGYAEEWVLVACEVAP